jgi:hypothetical protein
MNYFLPWLTGGSQCVRFQGNEILSSSPDKASFVPTPSAFVFYLTGRIDLYDYKNADSLHRRSCRDRGRQLGYLESLDTGEEVPGASSKISGAGQGSLVDRITNRGGPNIQEGTLQRQRQSEAEK